MAHRVLQQATSSFGVCSIASSKRHSYVVNRMVISPCKGMSDQQASFPPGPCQTDVDLEQEGFFDKWRANVGLCVVNSQGLVFAAQRTDTAKHTWQMPQGGMVDASDEVSL